MPDAKASIGPNQFVLGGDIFTVNKMKLGQILELCPLLETRFTLQQEQLDQAQKSLQMAENGAARVPVMNFTSMFENNMRIIGVGLGLSEEEVSSLKGTLPESGGAVDVVLRVAGLIQPGESNPVESTLPSESN